MSFYKSKIRLNPYQNTMNCVQARSQKIYVGVAKNFWAFPPKIENVEKSIFFLFIPKKFTS